MGAVTPDYSGVFTTNVCCNSASVGNGYVAAKTPDGVATNTMSGKRHFIVNVTTGAGATDTYASPFAGVISEVAWEPATASDAANATFVASTGVVTVRQGTGAAVTGNIHFWVGV